MVPKISLFLLLLKMHMLTIKLSALFLCNLRDPYFCGDIPHAPPPPQMAAFPSLHRYLVTHMVELPCEGHYVGGQFMLLFLEPAHKIVSTIPLQSQRSVLLWGHSPCPPQMAAFPSLPRYLVTHMVELPCEGHYVGGQFMLLFLEPASVLQLLIG